jgi:hypothetical protein
MVEHDGAGSNDHEQISAPIGKVVEGSWSEATKTTCNYMLSTYNGRAGLAQVGLYSTYAAISQQTHEVCSKEWCVCVWLPSIYSSAQEWFAQVVLGWEDDVHLGNILGLQHTREVRHNQILMKWMAEEFDLNLEGIEFLSFEPGAEYSMRAIYRDPVTRAPIPVIKDIFIAIVNGVNAQTSSIFHFAFLVVFSLSGVFSKHLMLIHIWSIWYLICFPECLN